MNRTESRKLGGTRRRWVIECSGELLKAGTRKKEINFSRTALDSSLQDLWSNKLHSDQLLVIVIMPPTTEIANTNGNGDQIKVGATGTISSLMSKELESIQHSTAQASSSSVKKLQGPPVSVPCGYSPKRTQLRKNLPTDPSCSANSSSINYTRSGRDITQKPKPKPRMNEHSSPMLASSEPTLDKTTTKDKLDKKKKGHTHIVEVVDIKCNNPMSSRLKKLGFSKLSEPTV